MKESHEESVEAWTQREEQVEEETQNYSQKFQKGYKVYQLSSELNTAHLQIQKLAIDFQREKREDRKIIDRVAYEKNDLAIKYETFMGEFRKISTMLQAEKTARKKTNQTNKRLQQQIKIIGKTVQDQTGAFESVLNQIQDLKNSKIQGEQLILNLNEELASLKAERDRELSGLKADAERSTKKMMQEYEEKISSFENELTMLKIRKGQYQATQKQCRQMRIRLDQVQTELLQKSNQLSSMIIQIKSKDEQLKNLRVKQEILTITREKSKEDKLKCDEKIQKLQFDLELARKRIDICEEKYHEEKAKVARVESMAQQHRQEIRKREEEQIFLQEECEQLKKQLYISGIYKEKYNKLQLKIRETEQRSSNFANIAEQYAQQIQQLQDALSSADEKIYQLQEDSQKMKSLLSQKINEISSLTLMLTHQTEIIKEKNKEITAAKEQSDETNKKLTLLLTPQNKDKRVTNILDNEDLLGEIKKKISFHYESLLVEEENIRKSLQLEINQTKKKVVELKGALFHLQKELAEERQDSQLAKNQNERLFSIQIQSQKLHEKKIVQMRDRYRDMNRVQSEKSFKIVNKKMRIENCFSYCLDSYFHKEKTTNTQITRILQKSQKNDLIHHQLLHKEPQNLITSAVKKLYSSQDMDCKFQNKIMLIKQKNQVIRRQLKQ